jgi:uncharacterized membrane protein YjgN (DUF898 family)
MKTPLEFDGKARDFIFVYIAAFLITALTLGFALPWAVVLIERWRTRHTMLDGRRFEFRGEGSALFGKYIIWWILTILTLGLYSIALYPRMQKWIAQNTFYELD